MLKIKCPKCKADFEADNSVAGHKLACECGASYEIPAAPPAGDFRICVNCKRLCEKSARVCPDCSFNFISGNAVGVKATALGENELSFMDKYKSKIIRLVLLFVAILLGIYIYLVLTGSEIGISSSAPLGVLGKDMIYNKLEFEKDDIEPSDDFKGLKAYIYKNKKKNTAAAAFNEAIRILVDDENRVHVISANYVTMEQAVAMAGTTGANFFHRMNKELKIPEDLKYEHVQRGEGRFAYYEYIGILENDKFNYKEAKNENPIVPLAKSSHKITISLAKYPLKKAETAFFRGFEMFNFDHEDGGIVIDGNTGDDDDDTEESVKETGKEDEGSEVDLEDLEDL